MRASTSQSKRNPILTYAIILLIISLMAALEVTGYIPGGGITRGSQGSDCLSTPYLSRNESAKIYVPIRALAVSPIQAGTVYLGTFTGIVVGFNTSTFGYRWLYMNGERIDVTGLVVDPNPPYRFYTFGHPPADVDTGVRLSCDGAQTWTVLTTRPDPHQWVVSEANSSVMYATDYPSNVLVVSKDGGSVWGVLSAPSHVDSIAIQPGSASAVLIGTADGIYISDDGGTTWKPLSSQLRGELVTAVVFVSGNPHMVYAYAGSRIIRSVDGGQTWAAISQGPGDNDAILNLASDPHNQDVLYASSNDNVYKTTDGGADWNLIGGVGLG